MLFHTHSTCRASPVTALVYQAPCARDGLSSLAFLPFPWAWSIDSQPGLCILVLSVLPQTEDLVSGVEYS